MPGSKSLSESKVIKCDNFPYQSIDSGLFYNKINERLTKNKNIKFFKNIKDLNTNNSFIFNSVPSLQDVGSNLWQHFHGIEIETNEEFFNDDDEHRLMIDVSRGLLGIYEDVEGLQKGPNLIIADFPLKWTVSSMGHLFDEGINAAVPSQRAIPAYLMDPKIKNRSRLFYLNANIEVSEIKTKNSWALLLDPDGFVTEGTGDNFFIVKDKKVISPEPRNLLRGISREYVMTDLCNQLGYEVIEKNIDLYDVYTADEAFMTGTPFCMLPVTSLNGLDISDGKRGEIFDSLLSKWSSNVGVDIEKQIKSWNKSNEGQNTDSPTPYKFK